MSDETLALPSPEADLPPVPDIAHSDEEALASIAKNSIETTKAIETYAGFLDELGYDLPEAETNRDSLLATGSELIRRNGIGYEFFSDPARAWAFTAISNRTARADDNPGEQTFLDGALVLLGHQYSQTLHDRLHDAATTPVYSDEHQLGVINQYTQPQVTADLVAALDRGLLDDVKTALGVTAENDDEIEVHVLSIGDEQYMHGLQAPPAPEWDAIEGDRATKSEVFNSAVALQGEIRGWQRELIERSASFRQDIGWSSVAGAWMTRLGGRTLLCVTLPIAEKVLYPETTEHSKWYGDKEHDNERAILGHERVHCTGQGLMIDGSVYFGITQEELRAEHFSGNHQGYQDAKAFGKDVGFITGKDLVSYMEGKVKGGTAHELYTGLAKSVGLDRALEIVMVRPRNYIATESNQYGQAVDQYLGGYNGVLERLYNDAIAGGRAEEVNARFDQVIRSIQGGAYDVESYAGYRRYIGVTYVSDMLEQRASATLESR